MKYEYKVVYLGSLGIGNNSPTKEEFAKVIEDTINQYVSNGWEYVDSLTLSGCSGANYLTFRRPK